MVISLTGLGVVVEAVTIAAIAKSILAKLALGVVSHWLAVREAAGEFREMKEMEEAGLRQLANLLAQGSDTPEWEWFQTMWNMKEFGLLDPPVAAPPADQPGQGSMAWAVVGALVISVVFLLRE